MERAPEERYSHVAGVEVKGFSVVAGIRLQVVLRGSDMSSRAVALVTCFLCASYLLLAVQGYYYSDMSFASEPPVRYMPAPTAQGAT